MANWPQRLSACALVIAMLGLAALFWLDRPASLSQGLRSLATVLERTLDPLVLAALGIWLLGIVTARFIERRPVPRRSPSGSEPHLIEGPPEAAERAGPLPANHPLAALPSALRDQRDLEIRRLRLEAFLRGEPDVIGFVDELLRSAWQAGASDLHLLPAPEGTKISLRQKGKLIDFGTAPARFHADIIRRFKVLAGLVAFKQKAQDGHLRIDLGRGPLDLRLSLLPTQHGEKAVLRFTGGASDLRALDQLGFDPTSLATVRALLEENQGLLIVCGPTGSGKSTTLYSALAAIHAGRGGRVSLATIEDPIERSLDFAAQTEVDRVRGLDFATSLRSVLRQDPNVLLIGEIRDAESAKIAVQAGLSGHLILTSLHADGVFGVFPRLIDLGVEPFLAASATVGCVAQRLVPALCPECRHEAPLDRQTRQKLRARFPEWRDETFFTAAGCPRCDGQGRAGLRALFEVLKVDTEMRRLLVARAERSKLEAKARDGGWLPLRQAAFMAAKAGTLGLEGLLEVSA